ncbi:MAG: agmatine deiminase family protein [Cytophagales bacterium]|nr:agmatine deiminase family protein [Cytophagales bacterium]
MTKVVRYPAEWEGHKATWLNFPSNLETWNAEYLPKVQKVYLKFIAEISQGEEVHINLNTKQEEDYLLGNLPLLGAKMNNVFTHQWGTNDAWMRDCGAEFVLEDDQVKVLNWKYNAWGGKYPPYDLDNAIPQKIGAYRKFKTETIDFVLEGGSIDTNGEGVMLTTTSCLLHPNRNPNKTQEEIESLLKEKYNLQKIIWLGNGIEGDDTDGHVDDITRFVNQNTVLTVVTDDKTDVNYQVLQDNLLLLKVEGLNVIELPMPKKKLYFEGERLPASYANFYICNSAVIVPIFEDENDSKALEIISRCFPDRRVVGIDSRDIIIGLGSFHCLSKQEPRL